MSPARSTTCPAAPWNCSIRRNSGSAAFRTGADGRFTLQAIARTPGRVPFRLRIRDATQGVVEDVEVPLLAVAGAPLRVRVLSGAPSPELKYLRRWALDAGVQLQSETHASPGRAGAAIRAPLTPMRCANSTS